MNVARKMTHRLACCVLFVLLLVSGNSKAAIDCAPIAPLNVNSGIEARFRALGSARLLSADVNTSYSQNRTDALSNYPNADELNAWKTYLFVVCQVIRDSSQLTDDQKLQRLNDLYQNSRRPPPGPQQVSGCQSNPAAEDGARWVLQRDRGARGTYDAARARNASRFSALMQAQGHPQGAGARSAFIAWGEDCVDWFARQNGG